MRCDDGAGDESARSSTHCRGLLANEAGLAMHTTVQKGYTSFDPSTLHPRFASERDADSCAPASAISPPPSPQDYAKNKATTINTMWTRVRSVDRITAAAVASKWPQSPSESIFPASPNIHTSFLLPPTPSSPLTSVPGAATDSYFPSILPTHTNAVQQKE